MTNSADPILTDLESELKTILWDNLIKAAKASMFSALPWLAVWPLGPIVTGVIGYFSDHLFAAFVLSLDLATIAWKDAQNQKTYDNELVKLKIIAHDKGVNSDEFKQARAAAAAALSQLTQFNR